MTPWRQSLYRELEGLKLEGIILDLGGTKNADYHSILQGEHTITTVNLDREKCDIVADVENKIPIGDGSFDTVIALNILEHIYNYQGFLSEIHRILKPGGQVILGVPFLVQVHPSPYDYFRYTSFSLEKIMTTSQFTEISIKSLGTGPGSALAQIAYNALYLTPLRFLAKVTGKLFDAVLRFSGKETFSQEYYPLGYFVSAKK